MNLTGWAKLAKYNCVETLAGGRAKDGQKCLAGFSPRIWLSNITRPGLIINFGQGRNIKWADSRIDDLRILRAALLYLRRDRAASGLLERPRGVAGGHNQDGWLADLLPLLPRTTVGNHPSHKCKEHSTKAR